MICLHNNTDYIRKLDNDTLNLYTLPVIELMSLGVTLRPSGPHAVGLGTGRNLIYEQDYWN